MYYTVKVQILTEKENGGVKKSTETYLVDAVSVTDAEAMVVEDFEGSNLEFEVKGVTKSQICKVITNEE